MNVACVMAGAASMYAYNRYRGPTCAKCRAPQPPAPSSRQTGGLLALEVGVLKLYACSLSAISLLS